MKLSVRHFLFAIALLGVLFIVFTRSDRVDFTEHKHFEARLTRVAKLDETLNADVLKTRFRLLADYDGLLEELEESKQTVAALADMPSFVPEARREPFRSKLKEVVQKLAAKEQLVEYFKSENAVLNNSLRYLPTASSELVARLRTDDEGRLLEGPMNQLIQHILVYCLDPGEDKQPAIRASLAELADWRAQHSAHPQAAAVARVAAHVSSIVSRKPKIEALTQKILSFPTGPAMDELVRLYDVQLATALHEADVLRWVLQGACLVLLLAVGGTIYRLNFANRNLERRVAERTAALGETNERFEIVTATTTNVIWDWDLKNQTIWWNENFQSVFGYPLNSIGHGTESWTDRIHPEDAPATLASIHAVIEGSERLWSGEYRFRRHDGSYAFVFDRGAVLRNEAGQAVRMIGAMEDISKRKIAEAELFKLSRAVEQSADTVVITDEKGIIEYTNPAFAALTGYSRSEVYGRNISILKSGRHPQEFYKTLWQVITAGKAFRSVFINRKKCGEELYEEKTITPIFDACGEITHFVSSGKDITERKRAEAELEKAHKDLLETSRQAGMAEVATSVLHNVGNVLNSVNVASACVADGVRKSKGATLSRIVGVLREHESDLGAYFTKDPRAKQLPSFLAQLADQLGTERAAALEELGHLQKNIEHIKEIVAMQQTYAKVSGVTETVQITDLIEDTLRMNAGSFANHHLNVVREFADVPPVNVEKHKVLQILVNLVRNAKHACDATEGTDKTMTLRVFNGGGRVKVSVSDNGVGIPPENLTRVFNHGFTTKKEGHGFGLHSGALAAKEMGGALLVHSEGTGRGATFTLELPVQSTQPQGAK